MAEKTEKMETINFLLLRHLGWQAKNIGPLFTTSASMFESGNRLLIAPLTGTVNQCQLMTSRFIRAKFVLKMELREDCLSSAIKDFRGNKKIAEIFAFVDSPETKKFQEVHPDAELFCRTFHKFYLGSASSGRGSDAANYVAAKLGDVFIGEILLFYKKDSSTHCVLQKFEIVRRNNLVKINFETDLPFGFVVGDPKETIEIPINAIKSKLFRFQFKNTVYMITMLKHYEHN